MATKDDGEKTAMGCLLAIVLTPFAMALRGFVLSRLWGWFVVPFGVPAVGICHAIGLAVMVGMVAGSRSPRAEDETTFDMVGRLLLYGFLEPLLCWLFGWACHLAATAGY